MKRAPRPIAQAHAARNARAIPSSRSGHGLSQAVHIASPINRTERVNASHPRAARSEQATKANATTRAVIAEIQRAGHSTLAAIAQELEARGVRTPAGRALGAGAGIEVAGGLSLEELSGESFALINSEQTRGSPLLRVRGGEPRVI
jgi:hypothetical protein